VTAVRLGKEDVLNTVPIDIIDDSTETIPVGACKLYEMGITNICLGVSGKPRLLLKGIPRRVEIRGTLARGRPPGGGYHQHSC
jgi:hypothetical protein